MSENHQTVYKVTTSRLWGDAQMSGVLPPSPIDVRDGYMHLSTARQLDGTLRLHFAGQSELVLLAVDLAGLDPHLKWEPSRGGDLFPHLYAPLPLSHITEHADLSVAENGDWPKPDWVK